MGESVKKQVVFDYNFIFDSGFYPKRSELGPVGISQSRGSIDQS